MKPLEVIFLLLPGFLGAQSVLDQWESVLRQGDPTYLQAQESALQEVLAAQKSLDSWFPQLSLVPTYTLSKTPADPEALTNQSLTTEVELVQKLRWGGDLTITSSQTLSQGLLSGSASYSSFHSAVWNLPLPGILVAGNGAGKASLIAAESRWTAKRIRLVASSLKAFLAGKILLERQAVRRKLVLWYQEKDQADFRRWEQGGLNSLALADGRKALNQAQDDWAQGEKDLADGEETFRSLGQELQTADLESWLSRWEADIVPDRLPREADWEAQEQDLLVGRSSIELANLAQLPILTMSFSLVPHSTVQGASDQWQAACQYWQSSFSENCTLSAVLTIPLVPWDPLYRLPSTLASQIRGWEAQRASLVEAQKTAIATRERKRRALESAQKQTQARLTLERDRLELYRLKVVSGAISPQDAEYQTLQVELVLWDWMTARLEAVAAPWLE